MDEKARIYGERYPLDEDFLAALAAWVNRRILQRAAGISGQMPGHRFTVGEEFGDDAHHLIRRLARAVDRFRHALAQRAVVVDDGVSDVAEGEAAQRCHCVVGAQAAAADAVEQLTDVGLVHGTHATGQNGRRTGAAAAVA